MRRQKFNNCLTRCNTKQSIYYSASSVYMFRMSAAPIIRSTQNCNYSLHYWSYCGWHPKHIEWTCRIINSLLCVASRWTVINTCSSLVTNPLLSVSSAVSCRKVTVIFSDRLVKNFYRLLLLHSFKWAFEYLFSSTTKQLTGFARHH